MGGRGVAGDQVENMTSRKSVTDWNIYSKQSRYAVMQLVEALHYKPAGCGFNSQWCQ
jgi:hypothetical protein